MGNQVIALEGIELNSNWQGQPDGAAAVRTALLVVDLAELFTTKESRYYFSDAEKVARRIAALAAQFREVGNEVIFTRGGRIYYTHPESSAEDDLRGPWVRKFGFVQDDPMQEAASLAGAISQLVQPLDDEVVLTKSAPSAFFATDLADSLRSNGVERLVVCGIFTSGCVRATVVDSFSHGFDTYVVEDCVADNNPLSHEVALSDISEKYATCVSADRLWDQIPQGQSKEQ